jgi:hypothetical protein
MQRLREAASVFVPLQVVTMIFFAEADAHEYVLWALWSALALSLKITVLLTRERFVRVRALAATFLDSRVHTIQSICVLCFMKPQDIASDIMFESCPIFQFITIRVFRCSLLLSCIR